MEHLQGRFALPPLDIVALTVRDHPVLRDPARELFGAYDGFLGLLSDESDIPRDRESEVARRLIELSGQRFPMVVHPDVIATPQAWLPLGSRLLLENMDRRKQVGRFADEFEQWFAVFPEAGLCLDVARRS